MIYKKILFSLILTVLLFTSISLKAEVRFCNILIKNKYNRLVKLRVELADNEFRRRKGLMFRKIMRKNHGMLFVFPAQRLRNFWMKNTYIPLSIAYISNRGRINEIYDMEPLDTSITYRSIYPARYAIEVRRGWFKRRKIVPGCRVIFNGCFGK